MIHHHHEPALRRAMIRLREHIDATQRDKYNAATGAFNVQALLTGPNAKAINLFSAAKYLTRYESAGFEKSGQTDDLIKAIHHLLIQLENEISTHNP